MSGIQLGTVAEATGALATFMAVLVALYIARSDSKDRRRREERQQATQISAYIVTQTGKNSVVLINASKEPVYDVVISYGVAYGAGMTYFKGNDDLLFIRILPSCEAVSKEPRNPGGGMHVQLGIAISFRDAKGRYWRRDATGRLEETGPTFKELEVSEPIGKWTKLNYYTRS
jgi:hypothetical protein